MTATCARTKPHECAEPVAHRVTTRHGDVYLTCRDHLHSVMHDLMPAGPLTVEVHVADDVITCATCPTPLPPGTRAKRNADGVIVCVECHGALT